MADFINTIDLLGDEVVAGMIVDKTITEFNDDVLTTVGAYAFRICKSLTRLDVPNAISIGKHACQACSGIKSLNIPKVTSLSTYAFFYCTSLANVYLPATPPTLADSTVFLNVPNACVFHIPAGSLSAYQNATNWSTLTGQYTFTEDA